MARWLFSFIFREFSRLDARVKMGAGHEVWSESLPETMIRQVMNTYRKAAWLRLIEERPEVGLAEQLYKQQKQQFKFHGPPQGATPDAGQEASILDQIGSAAGIAGAMAIPFLTRGKIKGSMAVEALRAVDVFKFASKEELDQAIKSIVSDAETYRKAALADLELKIKAGEAGYSTKMNLDSIKSEVARREAAGLPPFKQKNADFRQYRERETKKINEAYRDMVRAENLAGQPVPDAIDYSPGAEFPDAEWKAIAEKLREKILSKDSPYWETVKAADQLREGELLKEESRLLREVFGGKDAVQKAREVYARPAPTEGPEAIITPKEKPGERVTPAVLKRDPASLLDGLFSLPLEERVRNLEAYHRVMKEGYELLLPDGSVITKKRNLTGDEKAAREDTFKGILAEARVDARKLKAATRDWLWTLYLEEGEAGVRKALDLDYPRVPRRQQGPEGRPKK